MYLVILFPAGFCNTHINVHGLLARQGGFPVAAFRQSVHGLRGGDQGCRVDVHLFGQEGEDRVNGLMLIAILGWINFVSCLLNLL